MFTTETGYFKNIKTGAFYDHPIYLGRFDSPDNYIAITQEEFEKAQEEEAAQNA